uniref:Uncharacterized protein n=1 Tax=Prolemur simus TaxID=1328070 RepID=A0A8C9A7X5_PROSS
MILLWKNFILKRRQWITLVVEVILTFIFGATVLATRYFIIIKRFGPYDFATLSINHVPSYIRAPVNLSHPWELAYVPSKSTVVRDIVENVKQGLNTNMKVVGFPTEGAFEDYVRQKNNSKRVLAAIVFNHNFKKSDDPLPLQVDYYLRFSGFYKHTSKGELYIRDDWKTNFLFPPVSPVGPRNYDANGGSPGEQIFDHTYLNIPVV